MEEILASIKRVIAEDGRNPAPRAARRGQRSEAAPPPLLPAEDVLELDEPVDEGEGGEGLVSEDAAAASRQSLAALAAMRQGGEAPAPRGVGEGPLEAVIRDMLRPMLKEWLDQNLPEIVEELVTREIGRITGRSL